MEFGGLRVHLEVSRPADDDVADQRHPSSGMEHLARSSPADRRVDPVPGRRSYEDIEPPTAVVPLFERRRLDLDVRECVEPLAGERGHAITGLDGNHRAPERRQRPRRLPRTAADLENRRVLVDAADVGEVREQLVRVPRSHSVVQVGYLVEHSTEVASIRACHTSIFPLPLPRCRSVTRDSSEHDGLRDVLTAADSAIPDDRRAEESPSRTAGRPRPNRRSRPGAFSRAGPAPSIRCLRQAAELERGLPGCATQAAFRGSARGRDSLRRY